MPGECQYLVDDTSMAINVNKMMTDEGENRESLQDKEVVNTRKKATAVVIKCFRDFHPESGY